MSRPKNARKELRPAEDSRPFWDRFCWAALLPWALLAGQIVYAFGGLEHSSRVIAAHLALIGQAGYVLSLLAVPFLFSASLRRRLWEHLEAGGGAWGPGPWVAAAGIFAALAHLYLVRLFSHSLCVPGDTTDQLSVVWGLLHGRGTYSPSWGVDALSVHFQPSIALYAPFLLLLSRPWVPFLAQSALLASAGLAAFLLARRMSGSRAVGWLALFLISASPAMVHVFRSGFLLQVALAPLFLWAMHCRETGRRWLGVAVWAVLLGCSEQAAFTLAGFGLYLAAERLGERDRRGALEGLGLVLLAGALFVAEMKVKTFMDLDGFYRARYSSVYYGYLGGETVRFSAVLARLFSPSTYGPTLLLLLSFAFLPLGGGLRWLVLACAALPQLLADPVMDFHKYVYHQAAYVFGPAAWCALEGLRRFSAAEKRRSWLPVFLLVALGQAFIWVPIPFYDYLWPAYDRTLPAAVAAVPPEASVWADEAAGPALSLRPQVKLLATAEHFTRRLFLPEYVLMRKQFVTRTGAAEVLTLLAREGYQKIFDADALVVLKHPRAPFGGESPAVELPVPDVDAASAFGQKLVGPPDFPQEELKRRCLARRGWEPWARFAEELGKAMPPGSVLLHSGRFYPLPALLPVFGGREQIALGERLDRGGSGPGLAAVEAGLRAYRAQGTPVFTLAETFGADSMDYLASGWRFTKAQAEALTEPYRPIPAARLLRPGGVETLLLMWPKDPADARRLEETLRRMGFGAQLEALKASK